MPGCQGDVFLQLRPIIVCFVGIRLVGAPVLSMVPHRPLPDGACFLIRQSGWPSLECIKDRIASQNSFSLGPAIAKCCLPATPEDDELLPTCHAAAKNLRHPANPCSNRAPYR
jgi:hypothetical protein